VRILIIGAALLLVTGVFCGGNATDSPPAAGTPPQPGSQTEKLAAAGYPAQAFDPVTKAEMDEYVKAMPGVGEAFKAAGYKSTNTENIVADMAATIEGMKDVPGATAACDEAGIGWDKFRVTTYKIMSTTAAMAMGLAEAMAEGMAADDEESRAALAEIRRARAFYEGVPAENQTVIIEYLEQLEPLDYLDEE
jgi:hypothetical protein